MAIEQQIEELRRELTGIDDPAERLAITAELALVMAALVGQESTA